MRGSLSAVRKQCCLLVVALATLTLSAQEGRRLIQAFPAAKIGTATNSWCAVQDDAGVVYVGSTPVVSYDGWRWRRHEVPGSYAIRALAWHADRLWAGGVNEIGYFERKDGQLGSFHSLRPWLPANCAELGDVWQVFPRGEGAVFITHDRILWWNGREIRAWDLPTKRRIGGMQADGVLYVYELSTGLWRWEPNGLHLALPAAALDSAGILGLQQRPNGVLRFVTTQGIIDYAGKQLTPVAPEASAVIRADTLTAVCPLRSGVLAVGTLRAGLLLIAPDGTLLDHIDTEAGLPSQAVFSITEDRVGALWITSATHVSRIPPPSSPRLFDKQSGLEGQRFGSIARHGDAVAVAGAEAVFVGPAVDRAGEFHRLAGAPYTKTLLSTPEGWLLAGYHGISEYRSDAVRPLLVSASDVYLLQPAAKPGEFLVNEDLALLRLSLPPTGAPQVQRLAVLPDLPSSGAETSEAVWVSTTARGIFRVAHGKEGHAESCNPPGAVGHTLVATLRGQLVAFTAAGAFRWDEPAETFVPIPEFPAGEVQAVGNERTPGEIWVALRTVVAADEGELTVCGRLTLRTEGGYTWTPVPVEGVANLGGVLTLHSDERNRVWMGGTDAVLSFDPEQIPAAHPPAQPRLTANIGAAVELPANHQAIRFEFASVEFGRAEALRYETALGPKESDGWSPASATHTATFNNLRSGRYLFRVRAVSPEGLRGPAAVWRFAVLPAWYLRPAMLGLFGLAGASTLYGSIRWRLRRVQLHNERLAQLVRDKTAQLEKANAAKTDFVANMTHEIRNPISGILGLTLALQDTGLTARQEQLTQSVHSCAELLATLVEDVLDFAQIESGKFTLKPRIFAMRPLLEHTIAMVGESARQSQTPLRLELVEPLPPWGEADATRLQQILLNYLTNALKFAPGQEVILGAVASGEGTGIRFYVRDRGPGIPPAELPVLFDKFSRLRAARENHIRGTGLGLAVCRVLAEKMGGRVGVDAAPGAGACFWAVLPVAVAEPPIEPEMTQAPVRRVLVVEDLAYNATALQAMLRRLGFEAEVAETGPGALARLMANTYDVVFLDLNLPGMNGDEVARRFRAAAPASRTLLIATTTSTSPADQAACRAAGMDAFIAKPLRPDKLARALNDLLGCSLPVETARFPRSGDPTGIDLSLLRYVAEPAAGGLVGQIDRYLATMTDACDEAAASLTGDIARRQRAGHVLMSHARLIQADSLAELGRRFEAEAAGPVDELESLLAQYRCELAGLRDKLEMVRAGLAPR